MKEPMQLEEYLRESLKFTDAAHKFFDDPTPMNYYKLSAACESHQRVTETACAFVRKVLETRDPDLAERNKSQLRSYINAKGARLGVLEEKPTSEIAPTSDLHALRRLQHEPQLVHKFEQRCDLEILLAELASTLEQWNALYRELYSFVFWHGHPLPAWASSSTTPHKDRSDFTM